jgi:hypothetical protein
MSIILEFPIDVRSLEVCGVSALGPRMQGQIGNGTFNAVICERSD